METGRGFDEIRTRGYGCAAHGNDFFIGESCRFDDDLQDLASRNLSANGTNLVFDLVELCFLCEGNIDDHVDLVSAVSDRLLGLESLHIGLYRTRGESHNARHFQSFRNVKGKHRRRHAHRVGTKTCTFLNDSCDVLVSCLGLENRVINDARNVSFLHTHSSSFPQIWARGSAISII